LIPFTRRTLPLPEERGQGLTEYALILSLVAVLVIVALALLGSSVKTVYCQVISQFPGSENPCSVDVLEIITAVYNSGTQELHFDVTSDGDYDPAVTLTASPGGVMEERSHHYHLNISFSSCPCQVTVISSAGGSASVTVGVGP
jgi:pilus assembly protein Flp/PilA